MKKEKIIEVKNLKKYYELPKEELFQRERDYIKAVDDVSFDVFKGETFGIVGESGSGKSTVARLINRLIAPTDGDISFQGESILEYNKKEEKRFRRSIQMVFQSPYGTLDSRKTIGYSLREPFLIHKLENKIEIEKEIDRLLEMVELPVSAKNKYPHEFSGGQLQRINIARAIALQPEVIICDESVSALDVSIQAQILNLLNDLQKEFDLTYVFISHDLNVVRYMCDHVAVMHHGKIIEMGEAEEIYENPQDDYVKKLLRSIPIDSPHERSYNFS